MSSESIVEATIEVTAANVSPVPTVAMETVLAPSFAQRFPLVIPLVSTLVLIAIGLFVYVSFAKKQALKRPPSVVICGPSGSGKTALWTALTGETVPSTVTSFQANSKSGFEGKNYALVDYPGHNKLRQGLWTELNGGAVQGLVFVVDLASLQRNITETGSFLLDLLLLLEGSNLPLYSKRLLIVGNKSDVFNAAGLAKMRLVLQDELRQQKESRSKSVSESNVDILGKVFDFNSLETEVDFCETSVKRGSFAKVKGWLEEL
ncbi:Signal recognition particle receptor subunit beta [Yarrowia sp. C11]|nr:Signal recognition particle receptor subunit beta [Yarrowia sp. E02]KAG5367576.1 Signal recognition particle receptor subunit beta [Yarrowia sp. C11]